MNVFDSIIEESLDAISDGIASAFFNLDKVATGDTLRDTRPIAKRFSDGYQITIVSPKSLDYIDEGRAPGTPPPIGKIRDWLAARRLDYDALLTAKKIGREGIEGVPIKREIQEQVNARLTSVVNSARLRDSLTNYIDLKLKQL